MYVSVGGKKVLALAQETNLEALIENLLCEVINYFFNIWYSILVTHFFSVVHLSIVCHFASTG